MRTIIVVPYDPNWVIQFQQIATELSGFLTKSIISIEHVGSTSVPGLWAKPIIDIDIVIASGMFVHVKQLLTAHGYYHRGDLGITGREAFGYIDAEKAHHMTHHLYVCEEGNAELKQHLALRDYLREHPNIRDQYSQIKRQMAALHPHDIDAYLAGKESIIMDIYKKCDIIPWQLTKKEGDLQ